MQQVSPPTHVIEGEYDDRGVLTLPFAIPSGGLVKNIKIRVTPLLRHNVSFEKLSDRGANQPLGLFSTPLSAGLFPGDIILMCPSTDNIVELAPTTGPSDSFIISKDVHSLHAWDFRRSCELNLVIV